MPRPCVRSPRHLQGGFGLIAEIKECSPSHGPMRRQNVDEAAATYQQSALVRGISVLTNATHFGMSMERLRQVKLRPPNRFSARTLFSMTTRYTKRAPYGADAILLMANLLDAQEMSSLYEIARKLNMEALFECHTREQIALVPARARIYGINSRTFAAGENVYAASAMLGRLGAKKDLTVDLERFDLGQYLPAQAIKVAESGVTPGTVARLRDELGYQAALVGTSLLTASHGISAELQLFEKALAV